MAKIHRSDAPLPQTPSVQVKASYTVTDLPKVSPQEPAAFYDQDNDEDYRRRETAKCKKKRGNLLYTLAMIVFAAIFLISGGLWAGRPTIPGKRVPPCGASGTPPLTRCAAL